LDRLIFDWLAIVLLGCGSNNSRRVFIVPRKVADEKARRDKSQNTAHLRYWRIDEVPKVFGEYENNFTLELKGRTHQAPEAADRRSGQAANPRIEVGHIWGAPYVMR
jgi:hypothetical protein